MGWLIVGMVLGIAGFGLASWTRTKNISIMWYVWVFIVLAVLFFALTVMDFTALTTEMEPGAAQVILWLYGIPGIVMALIAVGVIWWQNKQHDTPSTKS